MLYTVRSLLGWRDLAIFVLFLHRRRRCGSGLYTFTSLLGRVFAFQFESPVCKFLTIERKLNKNVARDSDGDPGHCGVVELWEAEDIVYGACSGGPALRGGGVHRVRR